MSSFIAKKNLKTKQFFVLDKNNKYGDGGEDDSSYDGTMFCRMVDGQKLCYSSYKAVRRILKLIVIVYEKMFIARNCYYYKVFTAQNKIYC